VTARRRSGGTAVVAAVIACVGCCAGPLLAVLGGLSVASLAAAVWIPVLSLFGIGGLATTLFVRRRRQTNCRTGAEPGTVDVGMPAGRT
jgi:hypothetical protein